MAVVRSISCVKTWNKEEKGRLLWLYARGEEGEQDAHSRCVLLPCRWARRPTTTPTTTTTTCRRAKPTLTTCTTTWTGRGRGAAGGRGPTCTTAAPTSETSPTAPTSAPSSPSATSSSTSFSSLSFWRGAPLACSSSTSRLASGLSCRCLCVI